MTRDVVRPSSSPVFLDARDGIGRHFSGRPTCTMESIPADADVLIGLSGERFRDLWSSCPELASVPEVGPACGWKGCPMAG